MVIERPNSSCPSRDFWQGKRVLLTGHTGFKGSWLSVWLQSLGAELQGFALAPPSEPNLFDLARVSSGMKSFIGDIRDADAVMKVVASFRPDIVIHMAAQPLVRPWKLLALIAATRLASHWLTSRSTL